MKVQDITRLIEKFFNGETSLTEERQLYDYFNSGMVDADLKKYCQIFSDFSILPEPEQKKSEPDNRLPHRKIHRNFIRWISGIAASVLLFAGGWTAWNAYQNKLLYDSYGGSYMIVNGKRIDNLQSIKPYIENTLTDSRQIEKIAANQPSASDIEQELIDNISDPKERARIKNLLN